MIDFEYDTKGRSRELQALVSCIRQSDKAASNRFLCGAMGRVYAAGLHECDGFNQFQPDLDTHHTGSIAFTAQYIQDLAEELLRAIECLATSEDDAGEGRDQLEKCEKMLEASERQVDKLESEIGKLQDALKAMDKELVRLKKAL